LNLAAYRITVSGRVQGVGFRYSAKLAADRTRINGWVRHEYAGRVLLYAEGSLKACQAFIAWCKNGPSMARIDTVRVKEVPPEGIRGFSVRY